VCCVHNTAQKASSILAFQYENRRKYRNDNVEYRPKNNSEQRIDHYGKGVSIADLANSSEHDKDDNGNEESYEQTSQKRTTADSESDSQSQLTGDRGYQAISEGTVHLISPGPTTRLKGPCTKEW
jgi:hypothetical protein